MCGLQRAGCWLGLAPGAPRLARQPGV